MRAISHGNIYDIYDDSLKTYDQLPVLTYVVRFSQNKGFYLEKYVEMDITESKVYGVHLEKVFKVLKSFEKFNRSLGVILSGDKGIGKSLFAKLLAIEAMKKGIPLIVVDSYIPGVASYLESIEQEVMVLFDEFDKTFGEVRSKDDDASPQAHLLSLFDGLSGGKKLFVITCNELRKLNDYLINRPGRFHYHFRFDYPSSEEIRDYLQDKLDTEQYGEIDKVISFSSKVSLNYDCLRAIAFELNNGYEFKEAIKDLNIINIAREEYNVILKYKNGMCAKARNAHINMFSDESPECIYLYDNRGRNFVDVEFIPMDAVYDAHRGVHIIPVNQLKLIYDDDDGENTDIIEVAKATEVDCLMISRKNGKAIHYAV